MYPQRKIIVLTLLTFLFLALFAILPFNLTPTIKKVQATTLLSSGWEDSGGSDVTDGGKWTNSVGSPTVNSTTVKTGSYSMKANGANYYVNKSLGTTYNDLYVQTQVNFETLPSSEAYSTGIIKTIPSTHTDYYVFVNVVHNGSGVVFHVEAHSGAPPTSNDTSYYVQTHTWYRIELRASTTACQLWVNNQLNFTLGQQYYASDTVHIGAFDNALSNIAFYEDVTVATSHIGIPTDTTLPTYTNILTNQTAGNYTTHFNATLEDETGLSFYRFGFNNSGTWVNDTWTSTSGTSKTISVVKSGINGTLNNVVAWEVWFNDTSNNFNNTGLQYGIVGKLASDGYPVNIQTAINSVYGSGGGIVYVPEGNWLFTPSGNPAINISLTDTIGVSLIGCVENKTIIQMDTETALTILEVDLPYPYLTNPPIRISNLWFKGNVTDQGTDSSNAQEIGLYLQCDNYRIDHCIFNDFVNQGIHVKGGTGGTRKLNIKGLIDHCTFDNPYKTLIYGETYDTEWAYGVIIEGVNFVWDNTTKFKGSNAYGNYGGFHEGVLYGGGISYIENCYFNRCRHSIAGSLVGYYVVRYNYMEKAMWYGHVDLHGGSFGCEAYNNTIVLGYVSGTGSGHQAQAIELRGGYSLIYNNTILNQASGDASCIWLTHDSQVAHQRINDTYIWDNTFVNCLGTHFSDEEPLADEGVEYFLYAKQGYTAYPYPHPLQAGGYFQPVWDAINSNSTTPSGVCQYSVYWRSLNNTYGTWDYSTGLSHYWVETNTTSSMVNGTVKAFSSNHEWTNETVTLAEGGIVAWRIWANNSQNQLVSFVWQYIDLGAVSGKVLYGSITLDQWVAGQESTFTCNWTSQGISLVFGILSHNDSGTWENRTAVSLSGYSDVFTDSFRLTSLINEVVGYKFYGNNSAGAWNATNIYTLTTIPQQSGGGSEWIQNVESQKLIGLSVVAGIAVLALITVTVILPKKSLSRRRGF